MTDARLFDIVKPSDFVLALSADEGTKVDCPYRVVSVWRDENGGQGITVELEDGCGAGLNQGEYEPLFRAPARPMTVAEAAKGWLADYDGFMAGKDASPEARERIISLTTAATFAGAAYERGAGGSEGHALLRSFLIALIDPTQDALDYLRADPAAGQAARDADAALRALSQGGE